MPPVEQGETRSFFLPLALAWEDTEEERMRNLAVSAVARVRQQAHVGVMGDAFADEAFCRALVAAIGKKLELKTNSGTLRFRPTTMFAALAGADLDAEPMA